jgi:hypothetical protein
MVDVNVGEHQATEVFNAKFNFQRFRRVLSLEESAVNQQAAAAWQA